jgi:hypothetical protein
MSKITVKSSAQEIATAALGLMRDRSAAGIPISLCEAVATVTAPEANADDPIGQASHIVSAAVRIMRERTEAGMEIGVVEASALAEREIAIAAGPTQEIGPQTAVEYAVMQHKVAAEDRPWAIGYARRDLGGFMDLIERLPALD